MLEEKLKKESGEIKSTIMPKTKIVNYLVQAAKVSEELAVEVRKEEKTIAECLKHVEKKVREKLNNKSGHIEDQEVYDMAASYYLGKNISIKIEGNIAIIEDVTVDEKLIEKDKEIEKKDKEIEELKKRIAHIQESNKEEALKDIPNNVKKKTVKKEKNIEGQVSLFDI